MPLPPEAIQAIPELDSIPHISDSVIREVSRYGDAFLHASPFKHVVIEDFFESSFAEKLLEAFPSFDPKLAGNEFGWVGGKAVQTKIREINPVYQELFDAISSPRFLGLVSRVTGIPDMVFDPRMFGGGTHDNQHGQELDPHVDFNYDETQQLHRRVNLIVYLNKDWKTEWGGALEIHSNPRDPGSNRITSYDPLFNRCVLFETNEVSWHGFPRINLPADKRHLSRKSISIYLYTKTRPAEEIVPMHGTFYVQRPLPEHIQAGHTLTLEEADKIRWSLRLRDEWIAKYQRMELDKNGLIARANAALRDLSNQVLIPLTGYALQSGGAAGVFADQWVSSHAEIEVQPLAPVSGLLLRGWRPDEAPPGVIRASAAGVSVESQVLGGMFEISIALPAPVTEPFLLTTDAESQGKAVESTDDLRDLQFKWVEVRVLHLPSPQLDEILGKVPE